MHITDSPSVSELTDEQIAEFVRTQKTFRHISTNMKYLKAEIISRTGFLDELYGSPAVTITTRALAFSLGYKKAGDIPKCDICETERVMLLSGSGKFTNVCSSQCAKKKSVRVASERLMESHGVSHPMHLQENREKVKQSFMDRYGVEHVSKVPGIREKTEQTNLERYGAKTPAQNPEIAKKIRDTNRGRYGVDYTFQTEEFKKQTEALNMERYGVRHHFQQSVPLDILTSGELADMYRSGNNMNEIARYLGVDKVTVRKYLDLMGEEIIPIVSDEAQKILDCKETMSTMYTTVGVYAIADDLKVSDTTVRKYLRHHGIKTGIRGRKSISERQVFAFIQSLGFEDAQLGARGFLNTPQRELDIYIPSKQVAIEFNGLYWHSDKFKEPTYHLDKTLEADENGIRLLHLFEDEWGQRQDQVKAKIKSILGVDDREKIHARKCSIATLRNQDVKDFLDTNHIQGHVNATTILGLHHEGSLVAVMSFKHTRGYMELVRYATSSRVVGGFSKLLRRFWDISDVDEIVSFADIRWSAGGLYERNGWELMSFTKPNYYYVQGISRMLKQGFRKETIKKRYPDVYSPDKTERQMTEELGLLRIYDCGLAKYRMKRPS